MKQNEITDALKVGIEYGLLRKEFLGVVDPLRRAFEQPNNITAPLEALEHLVGRLKESYERSKQLEGSYPSLINAVKGTNSDANLNSEMYESLQKQLVYLRELSGILPNKERGRVSELRQSKPGDYGPNAFWT